MNSHSLTDMMRRPSSLRKIYRGRDCRDRPQGTDPRLPRKPEEWLDKTKGFDSYLKTMRDMTEPPPRHHVGALSLRGGMETPRIRGIHPEGSDSLADILRDRCIVPSEETGGDPSRIVGFIFSFKAYARRFPPSSSWWHSP